MSRTPNLDLPFILPAQAQKHVTHNEALVRLDDIVQMRIHSRGISVPPDMLVDGARYIVGPDGAGDWTGRVGEMAIWRGGVWDFIALKPGWTLWCDDEAQSLVYDGQTLVPLNASADITSVQKFGVNTSADDTTRLAVKSDSVLLSHDDIRPGNGDMRVTLNKAHVDGTASLIYQTGYSGRAEMGLTGDNNFSLNVSSDGQSWKHALIIDTHTGHVSLPETPSAIMGMNLLGDAGRFTASPDPQGTYISSFEVADHYLPYNGATFEQGPKFVHNNGTYGGGGAELSPIIDALMSRLRASSSRRYGNEFHSLKVQCGTGTGVALDYEGVAYYLSLITSPIPLPPELTINFHILVEAGSVAIGRNEQLFVDGELESHPTGYQLGPETGWKQITHHVSFNANTFLGYSNNLFRLYATPGSVFYIALPAVIPGRVGMSAGQLFGLVPNAQSWR